MDWRCDINWFAIHTKRFREPVAAASIAALNLETFLPMVQVECSERQFIKLDRKPLFPAYIFARFSPADSLNLVESARGALYVIKSGDCPVPVGEDIIRGIQSWVEEDGLIRLQRRELRPGDRVSVQRGPFMGMMGSVEAELDDHKRVAILLETLWNARVLIERDWLEFEAA
jgi:transcriptional antiterminator RfaH